MEPSMEELRISILVDGLDHENQVDIADVSMRLFGSLEQATGGKIRAGSLTDSRRSAYIDLIKAKRPYYDWESIEMETKEAAPLPEEEDRKQFLKDYEKWANTGGPVVATKLDYSDG
jgi:hypothetical protein